MVRVVSPAGVVKTFTCLAILITGINETAWADHRPGHRENDAGNSTIVVIPTRLAMSATVAPVDIRVFRKFRGRRERREFDLGDPSILEGINDVTRQMMMNGWRYTDSTNERGRRLRVFTRGGRELATFTTTLRITGKPPRPAVVTRNLNVQVSLKKPGWPEVRRATTAVYANDVEEAQRRRMRTAYKQWISRAINQGIAAREGRPVILARDKKDALRRPRRITVSQQAPISIGRFNSPLTVSVTSQVIDTRLGLP